MQRSDASTKPVGFGVKGNRGLLWVGLGLACAATLVLLKGEDAWQSLTALRERGEAMTRERAAKQINQEELTRRFDQGVAMLHMREYDNAVTAFHRVLELSPKLPEAHVNMGFALIGLKDFKAAADFFVSAIDIKSDQANAYYGLALAMEGAGNVDAATSAMRTYVHLVGADDPYRARAAEWLDRHSSAQGGAPLGVAR